ncbi:response regulator transcription factor [Anaeropeptidivorans aminofermentans]|jgi:DNA-binding response OmpR family regulator|uniref:response regulator transcription factor n=1 Tax=Anaeropeptidivorans aminofermentans TaxID=2934315 RepID=UPI002023CCCE|nr:response regulator transcription factor [Anaeropeptidivorans aminofermentans]MBE6012675.1 response regulator transcription factor [Lachnospiraceae bacterium]
MYKILIIEDDRVIAEEISKGLMKWGYHTEKITDFSDIINQFIDFSPHLVLMDISLPFYNGYHWCQEIRKISKAPVLFLSSSCENINIIMAINMGGDDFISKPFDMDMLAAKVQALLRRSYTFQMNEVIQEHNGAILNISDGTLIYNGEKIELTRNEFRMLQLFFSNKGKILSREALMKHLWESDCFIDDNTLTVNIARLRKKLEEAGLPHFISTKKGIGYILEDNNGA